MKNLEKVQKIIDEQITKILELSAKSKLPLAAQDINSLTSLAKLIVEGENLDKKEKSKSQDLSEEELLLIYEHRQKKKKLEENLG